jgi:hypothetical protein
MSSQGLRLTLRTPGHRNNVKDACVNGKTMTPYYKWAVDKRNGGEKTVGPYSLDGYDEETHTAYKFHGCFWHGTFFSEGQFFTRVQYLNEIFFYRVFEMLCQEHRQQGQRKDHA